MKNGSALFLSLLGLGMATACAAQTPAIIPGTVTAQPQTPCNARCKAAVPMARAIVTLMAQPPMGPKLGVASAKAALRGVIWHPRPMAPDAPYTFRADGNLGKLYVILQGRGGVDEVNISAEVDKAFTSPYDLPAALRARGVRPVAIACGIGGGAFGDERNTLLRIEQPGAVPYRLKIVSRDSATPDQDGTYGVTIYPGAPIPTLASLRAATRSTEPVEAVQWSKCD